MSVQGRGLGNVGTSYRTSAVQQTTIGQVTPNEYASLENYNKVMPGMVNAANAPVTVTHIPTSRTQVVPVWKSLGYNSLTHGLPYGTGGYHTIGGAYQDYPGNCGEYYSRDCAGNKLTPVQKK